MLENRTPVTYLKPKDGKMLAYRGKDENGVTKFEKFDRVGGLLTDISVKTGEYNGEETKNWQLRLQDGDEAYVVTFGYSSGFSRGMFNSLANADLNKPVKIGCYVKNEYNCPSVMQEGVGIVRWKYGVDMIPKTEKVQVGSKEVVNDEKAVDWMLKVVEDIKSRLPKASTSESVSTDEALEIMGGELVEEAEKKSLE
jgi:hypothetical protein